MPPPIGGSEVPKSLYSTNVRGLPFAARCGGRDVPSRELQVIHGATVRVLNAHTHRMRCDRQTPQETRPCSPRPQSKLLSLSALPQARLLGPSSTAATLRTTCSSTANTSARIPIRPSAPCSRVTPASSDGSPSQVAAGCPAGPPLVSHQNFDFARWNFD